MAFALLIATFAFSSSTVAYSCVDGHCYGAVGWNGNVHGAVTRISVNPMYMNNGSFFITKEMWLVDTNGSCMTSGELQDRAWVEVGMHARDGLRRYFYAKCPNGGSFSRTLWSTIPSGDYFTTPYFEINRSGVNQIKAKIRSNNFSADGYSINNNMSANQIIVGEEVYSNTGGYANEASWTDNRYIHSGNHYHQHRDGDFKAQNAPVQSWWATIPAMGNNGGDWRAKCQCGS